MEVVQLQSRAGRLIDLFQLGGDGQSGIEGGLDRPERPKDEIFVVGFGHLNVGQSEAVGARDDGYAHILDRDGFAERNAALAGVELTEVSNGIGPNRERILGDVDCTFRLNVYVMRPD